MAAKPAYVKPLRELMASSSRVQEQIKGRLLYCYVETLNGGKEKATAIIVDKDKSLKGVLVLEAWSPKDQDHMKQTLKKNVGQVVSMTNSKIQSRGKTLVYFDVGVKMAFDKDTKVTLCGEDAEYPTELPPLPDIKHATSLTSACMISVLASVVEGGQAVERPVPGGKMKSVSNLKIATGNNEMAAAFWNDLAVKMERATVGQVYRLDCMVLKPEGGGNYQLSSISSTTISLIEGSSAKAVSDNLGDAVSMQTMSARYRKSREDKLKEPTSRGSLTTLEAIETLELTTSGVLLVPASYGLDVRGMSQDSSTRAWYLGCTQCKKQLATVGLKMQCSEHGENKGKKVYAAQILFADPGHKKELAVWGEVLKAMAKEFMQPGADVDADIFLEQLMEALKGKELCLRIGIGTRKNGLPYLDVFDVTSQVTADGCLALYKSLTDDSCEGTAGLAPACCKNVALNELGQLTVQHKAATQIVDRVKMMVESVAKPKLEVPQEIDGIKVTLECKCMACNADCKMVAAGVPNTVQDFMSMPKGSIFAAFAQTMYSDGEFQVANHVQFQGDQNHMEVKVFRYEVEQFKEKITRMAEKSKDQSEDMGAKRTLEVETLMSASRVTPRRIKLRKTSDGNQC